MKSTCKAQIVQSSANLPEDINFLINLGFKLMNIFPDDDPEVAVMNGHGVSIRLDKTSNALASVVNILTDTPEQFGSETSYVAPNKCRYEIVPLSYQIPKPETKHTFEVRQLRDQEPWVIGRAGMMYRDLVPNRLGGGIMASHIRIPTGGPVPDMVHYHTIGFQLIYCYKGWVKLVYEDQGEPFVLNAGDCVTQPPEIRHRVLEASDNLEVIEIGVPAEHMTSIDHEMELPTKEFKPEREFQGQRFVHHKEQNAVWTPWRLEGFEHRETGINEATQGIASVHIAKSMETINAANYTSHNSDILFSFVLSGNLNLTTENKAVQNLNEGDAFVIPPDMKYMISETSNNLQIFEISLPGTFETTVHS
ncbi:MAG: quercetin dioxygenase-like cupin family protein [Crocinitomicaceae bacterium]|jgi:quercetin dioxygenase-like cupin family protein